MFRVGASPDEQQYLSLPTPLRVFADFSSRQTLIDSSDMQRVKTKEKRHLQDD